MSIKERLVRIMNSEGLNASLFADRIGVQRSSISHILSGRNKPSLDFLEKILGAYPKYNAEWLVMGTGQVYKAPKQYQRIKHQKKTQWTRTFNPWKKIMIFNMLIFQMMKR